MCQLSGSQSSSTCPKKLTAAHIFSLSFSLSLFLSLSIRPFMHSRRRLLLCLSLCLRLYCTIYLFILHTTLSVSISLPRTGFEPAFTQFNERHNDSRAVIRFYVWLKVGWDVLYTIESCIHSRFTLSTCTMPLFYNVLDYDLSLSISLSVQKLLQTILMCFSTIFGLPLLSIFMSTFEWKKFCPARTWTGSWGQHRPPRLPLALQGTSKRTLTIGEVSLYVVGVKVPRLRLSMTWQVLMMKSILQLKQAQLHIRTQSR